MSMDAETGLPRHLTTNGGDALPDYWGEHEMTLDRRERDDDMEGSAMFEELAEYEAAIRADEREACAREVEHQDLADLAALLDEYDPTTPEGTP